MTIHYTHKNSSCLTPALNVRSYTDCIDLRTEGGECYLGSGTAIGEEIDCKSTRVIKTARNIRIYRPQVFLVRYEPNQPYYQEYGWE